MAERIKARRCAIYTRKSSEEGLDQAYNSLDAQRDACAAYIASQKHEGWVAVEKHYDDGGFSGGSLERPALQALFADARFPAPARLHAAQVRGTLPLTRTTSSVTLPRTFLLGDAGGYVEPFTGEGMSWALSAAAAVVPLAERVVREGWSASTATTGKPGAAIDSAIVGVVDSIEETT